jgi:hypothetical protein
MARRKVGKRSKHTSKPLPTPGSSNPGSAPVSAEAERTRTAVASLLAALKEVSRHNEAALEGFESIRLAAAERREGELVAAALQDHLLDDLAALDRILSAAVHNEDEALVRLRAVPAAVLRWAAANMALEPTLAVGDEREVPVTALERYDCDDAAPAGAESGQLVTVRIVTSGWKWRGKVVAKPRVLLGTSRQTAALTACRSAAIVESR